MNPAEDLGAEFVCGCSVGVSPEWSIALWQCADGEDCPAWRLITGALEQCVRQLRVNAMIGPLAPPPGRTGPGAGGSL